MSNRKAKDNYLLDEEFDVDTLLRKSEETILHKRGNIEALLKGVRLKCKNQKQKEFVKTIDENEITICIGDSGVGKSYLSLIKALELLKDPSRGFEKIFIITPIVEIESESIGYLKGSLDEKLSPYLYSIYYLIDKIVGEANRKKLVENKIVEPICLSYMRGINFEKSVIISDESQNISKKGMLTMLARIGSSKYIVSGDLNQIDKFKNPNDSGLKYAYEKLQGIKGIGFVEFGKEDIVRNPIIGHILDRFKD